MNICVNIQYDADREGGRSVPLAFGTIEAIRQSVNAPTWATIDLENEPYGWEINIHWDTDAGNR